MASALSASLVGCRISANSYCNQICDCTGCSDGEKDDCVDNFDDAAKTAEDEGCEDQFDDVVSCSSDELECTDGVASADGCDVELKALADCTEAPIGVGSNSCESANARILARFESCGVDTGDPDDSEPMECTPDLAQQVACFESCVDIATCEDINQSSGPWIDCLTSC